METDGIYVVDTGLTSSSSGEKHYFESLSPLATADLFELSLEGEV